MVNTLISPARYIQGAGAINDIATQVKNFGKKFLIIVSKSGMERVKAAIEESFSKESELRVEFVVFNGECSQNEINRLLKLAEKCDAIIGVGGGKILDTAKAVAYYKKSPVIIVPTIASTDAPCSALSVLYSDAGVFEKYLFLPRNPEIVLLDSAIIAQAPARLLISGMGDALATYFEGRSAVANHAQNCGGGHATTAAFKLAELCYETLLEEGLKAKLAIEKGVVTPAVDKIIEANTLLSGIGFESCGLAAAHSVHNGLTRLKGCHQFYHGEKVAFGTIVQLVLENSPLEELEEVIDFCLTVGLPITLSDIGLDSATDEELHEVAMAACAPGETIHNTPGGVTPTTLFAALKGADSLGNYYKSLQ